MTVTLRLLLPCLGVVALLLAACNGSGDGPQVSVVPSPSPAPVATSGATATAAATPTATPSPASGPTPTADAEPPHAPDPVLDPGLTPTGGGDLNLTVGAGGVEGFDPVQLALSNGIDVPPCAGFVFAFTWQVRDPYPLDGVSLEVRWTRMGGGETIGTGPSGEGTVGCMFVEIENSGVGPVTVEIRFTVAELSG